MIFRKWGGGGSKAVWNFSENSSVLGDVGFPYLEHLAPIITLLQVWDKFCQYFCTEDILDLCDVNSLPGMDDWNSDKPHGMFWRMQVPP